MGGLIISRGKLGGSLMDGIFQYLSELLCSWNIKQSFDSLEWLEAHNQSPVPSHKIKNLRCSCILLEASEQMRVVMAFTWLKFAIDNEVNEVFVCWNVSDVIVEKRCDTCEWNVIGMAFANVESWNAKLWGFLHLPLHKIIYQKCMNNILQHMGSPSQSNYVEFNTVPCITKK